jgi:hypothetical protein
LFWLVGSGIFDLGDFHLKRGEQAGLPAGRDDRLPVGRQGSTGSQKTKGSRFRRLLLKTHVKMEF